MDELLLLKKNDVRKKVIAWYIRKQTSVNNEWIANHVHMGCVSNMSQYVAEVEKATEGIVCKLKKMLK